MSGPLTDFVSGLLAMGQLLAGLFFLRFWRDTRDRLFLFFAAAFGLLAVQRTVLTLFQASAAVELPSYSLRLLAFVLILAAIVDKNVRSR
jgi:hypothetical protein